MCIYQNQEEFRHSEPWSNRVRMTTGEGVKLQATFPLTPRTCAVSFSCLHLHHHPVLVPHRPLRSPMGPCPATNSHLKAQNLQVKISLHASGVTPVPSPPTCKTRRWGAGTFFGRFSTLLS